MSEKKHDEEKLAVQSVPGLTVVLDTSGEGHAAINDQVSIAVAHFNDNYEAPASVIENDPENEVTVANVVGESEDNEAPLDEDSVAGHPINDGKKDPADAIGSEHIKKDSPKK